MSATSQQDRSSYRVYVDWIRAAAILFGIPFHVGLIYSAGNDWFISNDEKSLVLTAVTGVLSSARMPLFFAMAGMLTALVLTRKPLLDWLKSRSIRLGVPLVASTLLLNIPVMVVIALQSAEAGTAASASAAFWALLQSGGNHWVGHLWFLYVLIWLSLFTSVALKGLLRLQAIVVDRFCDAAGVLRLDALFKLAGLVAVYMFAIEAIFFFALTPESPTARAVALIKLEPFFEFLPYYLLGFVLYRVVLPPVHRDLRVLVTAGLAVALYAVVWNMPDMSAKIARYLTGGVSAVLWSAIILSWAERAWTNKNTRVQRIVDASFTIYLVHYPICVVIGYVMTEAQIPIWLGYTGNIALTFVLSLALHALISRSALTLFLFNGITPPGWAARRTTAG
ncbi:MAG: acyltransferase family protein [Pseudomonadota bacterium]